MQVFVFLQILYTCITLANVCRWCVVSWMWRQFAGGCRRWRYNCCR